MTEDFLQNFSWGAFAVIAVLYTLTPLLSSARWGKLNDITQFIAAVRTAPGLALSIHLGFLGLLLALLWTTSRMYSDLPDWATRQSSKGTTILDIVVLLLAIAMVVVEERLIRTKADLR